MLSSRYIRGAALLAFALFFLTVPHATHASPGVFGRYIGTLRHDRLGKEQLAKLDLIPGQEENNVLQLMAVLTLHFGDFSSDEYVNYHFDNVRYHLLTRTLVFDQPDQPLTFIVTEFSADELVGKLRAAFVGEVGTLSLRKDQPAAPTLPLIEPVWGFYHGTCDGQEHYLQLVTYRSTDDTSRLGNPFGTYFIKGELSWASDACLGAFCTLGRIWNGSYDFFKDEIRLLGNRSLVCRVKPDSLECNGNCRLTRTKPIQGPRTLIPPKSQSVLSPPTPDATDHAVVGDLDSLGGEYVGYLHHEYLDHYQLASLNIRTFQESVAGGTNLKMSAIAALHFGSRDSSELVTYRFTERTYPNPVTAPLFLFRRPETDVDAILQVTQIGRGVVKGTWFSLLFGRVGTFELRKAGPPQLPESAKLIGALSGRYESENWFLQLVVGLGRTPQQSENPFYPLTFGGALSAEVIPPIAITGGSYDFYTGKIAFEVNDGAHVLAGQRPTNGRLLLRSLTPTRVPTFTGADAFNTFIYRGPITD